MKEILIAAGVLFVIGAVSAAVLALAARFMGVSVDEKFIRLRECLPGINCGACGYSGCDG